MSLVFSKALRESLGEPGRVAWKDGVAALGDNAEKHAAAIERYARAVDLAASVREKWVEEGCPLMTLGGATGRAEVEHPLIGMIAKAEKQAHEYGRAIGVVPPIPTSGRKPGRPRGASSAPDRVENRPGLRSVKP